MPRRGGAVVVQVWHGGSPSLVSFRPPTIGGLDGTSKEPPSREALGAAVKRRVRTRRPWRPRRLAALGRRRLATEADALPSRLEGFIRAVQSRPRSEANSTCEGDCRGLTGTRQPMRREGRISAGRIDQPAQLGEDLGIGFACRAAMGDPLLDVLAVGQAGQADNADAGGGIE